MHYGEWHHFVGTFNAGVVNLYLDGSNVVNDDTLTVDFADTGNAVHKLIGSWTETSGNYWNGTLDEIQIFDKSLSADEVQALYALKVVIDKMLTYTEIVTAKLFTEI